MRHYDPDDPIWTEDEDRAAARRETLDDWHDEQALEQAQQAALTVVGVAKDEGSVVVFRTSEGPLLALHHSVAQQVLSALEADGEVEVVPAGWDVL